jgi:hypothetical protein
MPITFAHPVAAIPLRRPLARLGVLAALVIGSVMPDVPLFLPIAIDRNVSHSFIGLFTFCLPMGVIAYVLYDLLLEEPVTALMPDVLQRRLAVVQRVPRPMVIAPAVLLSLLAGAATHSAWDSFTHGGAAAVRLLPVLETRLFTISGYTAYVFSVLQHVSSLLGTITMAVWIVSWYRRAPQDLSLVRGVLPIATRHRVMAAIAGVVVLATILAGATRFPARATIRAVQPFLRRVVVTALSSLVGALLVYAMAWHWRLRRDVTPARSRS